MRDVRALENHRFRRKLVQIRRVNPHASVASERIGALLVRKEQDYVRLSFGHEVRVRTKSAVVTSCNDSSGERTRLACWRSRPRDRELFPDQELFAKLQLKTFGGAPKHAREGARASQQFGVATFVLPLFHSGHEASFGLSRFQRIARYDRAGRDGF